MRFVPEKLAELIIDALEAVDVGHDQLLFALGYVSPFLAFNQPAFGS